MQKTATGGNKVFIIMEDPNDMDVDPYLGREVGQD